MSSANRLDDKTVLVVDDNPFDRDLIYHFLRSHGVGNVLTAHNAAQALALLDAKPVDCMVVDWEMTPHSGLMLVRQIRRSADKPFRTVSIVLCTSHTEKDRIFEARDAGIDEIIAKPFSPAIVKQKLSAALFNRREFVITKGYVGPDRRRFVAPWDNDERREDQKSSPS